MTCESISKFKNQAVSLSNSLIKGYTLLVVFLSTTVLPGGELPHNIHLEYLHGDQHEKESHLSLYYARSSIG